MSGKSKKDIEKEFGVKKGLLWRIVKDRDRSNKNANMDYNIKIRHNIEKWINEEFEYYIKKYINWEIKVRPFEKLIPFDIKTFNILENIKRNKKYCCTKPDGSTFLFDTAKELSEELGVVTFYSGFSGVIKGRGKFYKGCKYRKATVDDHDEPDYEEMKKNIIVKLWKSLDELKFNNNRGIKKIK